MKNLVLTFLLALLVVLTAISVRRVFAGNATFAAQRPNLVAIGGEPIPLPPRPTGAIGGEPIPLPPRPTGAIGGEPIPLPPRPGN